MQGVITGKDILLHSLMIVREFGPATYLRCLQALASGRPCTFLDLAWGR